MSLKFSDTTNKNGIVQNIEDECGFNDGDISGDTTLLAKMTANVNNALDEIFALIFSTGGTWQFDDINHPKYPIITTNLVSGQRDYAFTTDEQGNVILDIYKVMIDIGNGTFKELTPVDQQSPHDLHNNNIEGFVDGLNRTGVPERYDKTSNGIFLDLIPNYEAVGGLKVYINREASYFTVADTTKKAGFSGLFHYLLVLITAYKYARIHSLPQIDRIKNDLLEMKNALVKHYGKRERDIKRRLSPKVESNK